MQKIIDLCKESLGTVNCIDYSILSEQDVFRRCGAVYESNSSVMAKFDLGSRRHTNLIM